MMNKAIQREVDVKLMAAILEARQFQGAKMVSRREMFDYLEPISPRQLVNKQKLGVDFSNMLEDAATLIGAKFTYETHSTGKRKKVRVEF